MEKVKRGWNRWTRKDLANLDIELGLSPVPSLGVVSG